MRARSQSFIFRLAYTLGLRLAQVGFIRRAIDDHADLGGMGPQLIFRLILGLLIIAGSSTSCWPMMGLVTALSVRTHHPLIALIGCPVVYGIAFVLCGIGMALAGGKRAKMFLRWRARLWVQWLLSHGPINARRPRKWQGGKLKRPIGAKAAGSGSMQSKRQFSSFW